MALEGKRIIVTRTGRGIGAEISRDLARNGAKVRVAALNSKKRRSHVGLRDS